MAIARSVFGLVFGFFKPLREHREIADTRGELREKHIRKRPAEKQGATSATLLRHGADFVPGVCGMLSPKFAVPRLLRACSMLGLKIEAEAETEAETETEIEANTETDRKRQTCAGRQGVRSATPVARRVERQGVRSATPVEKCVERRR